MKPVVNIGPAECKKRRLVGIVFLLVSVACVVALRVSGASPLMSSGLFIPLFASGLGFAQAHERTCVALVAIKQQNLDHGAEPVTDPAQLRAARSQGRRVLLHAALGAASLTALNLLLH